MELSELLGDEACLVAYLQELPFQESKPLSTIIEEEGNILLVQLLDGEVIVDTVDNIIIGDKSWRVAARCIEPWMLSIKTSFNS
jgi:hypothetical protein